ncbi:MAG: DNA-binding protein [Lachnospiraceae bacterium]|nr:DNA-binding protein [Lachnospiraceae bacterium]
MKCYEGGEIGKVIMLELERGDDIFEEVEKALEMAGIKDAYIASAVGSVEHLEYHRPTDMGVATADEMLSLEGPFELGGITGTVIDGAAHFHFTAGGVSGNHIGHLERGTKVLYLLELVVTEIKGFHLVRKMTEEKVNKLFPVK